MSAPRPAICLTCGLTECVARRWGIAHDPVADEQFRNDLRAIQDACRAAMGRMHEEVV